MQGIIGTMALRITSSRAIKTGEKKENKQNGCELEEHRQHVSGDNALRLLTKNNKYKLGMDVWSN